MAGSAKSVVGLASAVLIGLVVWTCTRPRHVQITAAEMPAGPASEPGPPTPLAVPPRPEVWLPTANPAPRDLAPPVVAATGSYVIDAVVRDVSGEGAVPNVTVIGSWYAANPMLGPMRLQSGDSSGRTRVSAVADSTGHARIEVARSLGGAPDAFDVGRGWHVLRWHHEGAPDERILATGDGGSTSIVIWARRAFWLTGRVIDEEGKPVAKVRTSFAVPQQMQMPGSGLGMANVIGETDMDGRFDLGPFAEEPVTGYPEKVQTALRAYVHVTFAKDGYATQRFDPRGLPATDRDRLTVTLTRGTTLAGTLVDDHGRALADVPVVVEYGAAYDLRKGVRTDAEGRWRLERLSIGPATLIARDFAHDAKVKREITVGPDDLDVRLIAETIRLSHPPATVPVLGLSLCDVDDEIRAAYDVPEHVNVLILDAGSDPERLGIGRLEKGFGLWMVGDSGVTSIREALERLIDDDGANAQSRSRPGHKRVVYTFWGDRSAGTNTQYVRVSAEDREALKATLDALPR